MQVNGGARSWTTTLLVAATVAAAATLALPCGTAASFAVRAVAVLLIGAAGVTRRLERAAAQRESAVCFEQAAARQRDLETVRAECGSLDLRCREVEGELQVWRDRAATMREAIGLAREAIPVISRLAATAIGKSEHGSTALTDDVYSMADESRRVGASIEEFLDDLVSGDRSLSSYVRDVDREIALIDETVEMGDQAIARLAESIDGINRTVTDSTKRVRDVAEIAERTNVLAINAAIYAAKAGERGRGFSVIAGEVQKLASTTQSVAAEIEADIRSIIGRVRILETDHRERTQVSHTRLRKAIDSLRESAASMAPRLDRIRQSVVQCRGLSDAVTERLSGMSMALQEHDAVQQIVSHIVAIVEETVDEPAGPPQMDPAAAERIRRRIEEISTRHFTMEAEYDRGDASTSGIRVVSRVGDQALAGDITLFS